MFWNILGVFLSQFHRLHAPENVLATFRFLDQSYGKPSDHACVVKKAVNEKQQFNFSVPTHLLTSPNIESWLPKLQLIACADHAQQLMNQVWCLLSWQGMLIPQIWFLNLVPWVSRNNNTCTILQKYHETWFVVLLFILKYFILQHPIVCIYRRTGISMRFQCWYC